MARLKKTAFIILFFLGTSGCTNTYVVGTDTQSHFEYPNSNVLPLGKTSGEATKTTFFNPPFVTAELDEAAIDDAISKVADADILVDFVKIDIRTTIFIFFHSVTRHVEGTAAKMVVGTQILE